MNVLLVYPDTARAVPDVSGFLRHNFPSLGVNSIASVLRHAGHDVCVRDVFFVFTACDTRDLAREVEALVRATNPDVVGVSFLTPSRTESLSVARRVKLANPRTIVVAGGAHATVMWRQLLEHYQEIDVVVRGEGEVTFLELVEAAGQGRDWSLIKGVAHRSGDKVVATHERPPIADLDSLPFPDYSQYREHLPGGKLPTAAIVTGRGCAYGRCSFCASRSLWPSCRTRSVENVVREIEKLLKEDGVENIRIHDDTYAQDALRAEQIFRNVVRRGLRAVFDFKSRMDKVTPELLRWYKEAGGRSIFYGLESGSERIRNSMTKAVSDEQIEDAVRITKEAGIKVGLFVMFGYPGETLDDIRQTYRMLERLKPDKVRCMLTKAYPGTPLFEYAKKEGLVTDEYWLSESPEHRYFTFLNDDQIAEIKGYDMVFRERFNGSDLWAEYDEQDIPYYLDGRDLKQLRDKAITTLVQ